MNSPKYVNISKDFENKITRYVTSAFDGRTKNNFIDIKNGYQNPWEYFEDKGDKAIARWILTAPRLTRHGPICQTIGTRTQLIHDQITTIAILTAAIKTIRK